MCPDCDTGGECDQCGVVCRHHRMHAIEDETGPSLYQMDLEELRGQVICGVCHENDGFCWDL